jgi:hypothetical protein
VPSDGRGKSIKVLLLNAAPTLSGVIDTKGEDVIGRSGLRSGNRYGSVRGPIDNRDNPVRGNRRDGSLIPIVLHLNFELRSAMSED